MDINSKIEQWLKNIENKEYVNPIPKPDRKKHSRKSIHDFPASVKKKEYEEAKGLCRICQAEPIKQYHHITEKGIGGGRGLGIQINCLGVGDRCHNHDNTEFLQACDSILEQRIDKIFDNTFYIQEHIQLILKCDSKLIEKQRQKGFLKMVWMPYGYVAKIEDIKRWLKGVA